MSRPVVTAQTELVYGRLPEVYRTQDAQDGDWPFLRWISLLTDQWDAWVELVDDPGKLGDPAVAREAWLLWLGQVVGVSIAADLTVDEKRDAITYASAGWRAGETKAVADAARSVLTGSKYVRVFKHATSRGTAGQDPWFHITIVTRPDETPDPDLVLETVVRKGAKPAGVLLHHEAYAASWTKVEAAFPSWADWNDAAWRTIEETP